MPKKLSEDLIARIVEEIARHPEGVGIDDLHADLADVVSRRTWQRRLALLVEPQPPHARGEGRPLEHHLAPFTATMTVTLAPPLPPIATGLDRHPERDDEQKICGIFDLLLAKFVTLAHPERGADPPEPVGQIGDAITTVLAHVQFTDQAHGHLLAVGKCGSDDKHALGLEDPLSVMPQDTVWS